MKTLGALPERLRKAFLEGNWDVFAGQYFDVFEIGRHTARAEELGMQKWWPRWISVDWGFHHPSAVYWHCAVPEGAISDQRSVTRERVASDEWRVGSGRGIPRSEDSARNDGNGSRGGDRWRSLGPAGDAGRQDGNGWKRGRRDGDGGARTASEGGPYGKEGLGESGLGRCGPRVITYREFVKSGLSPRMLGQAIAELSEDERIADVYLSPDAFAHPTSEASIAEQLGEVLEQNGLPRPVLADDDRVGGWQLMYQRLESDAWVITENCRELIECLPALVRDERRVEDVRKVEGDDAADAARYGLVSGVRYAGFGAHRCAPGAGQAPPDKFNAGAPRFVPGMPLGVQIDRQISAKDPTSRAIHQDRLLAEAKKQLGGHKFGGKKRWKW